MEVLGTQRRPASSGLRAGALALLAVGFLAAPLPSARAGVGPEGHAHEKVKRAQPHEGERQGPPGGAQHPGAPRAHREEGGPHREGRPEGHPARALSALAKRGKALVRDLHCNGCHIRIEEEHVHGAHRSEAPPIGYLGDKLRPDWLFDFLRSPRTIRPWVKMRMPDFRLTEREALALSVHISRDMRDPRARPLPAALRRPPEKNFSRAEEGAKLIRDFECAKCHPQIGQKPKPGEDAEQFAPPFEVAAERLKGEWIVRFLYDPQAIYPGTKMPNFFYDAGEPLMEGADEAILAIRDYFLKRRARKRLLDFSRARARFPAVEPGEGFRLMEELNCAGCHDVKGNHHTRKVGPVLAHAGSRLRRKWVEEFLRLPYRVRPDGYVLRTAVRMPTFPLSREEARSVAAYLMTLKDAGSPQALPRGDANRGQALFRRLACGACHSLRGAPAQVVGFRGPDLTHVARRLKGPYLIRWLSTPTAIDAHPLVPNYRLEKEELADLVAYLMTLR